MNDTRDNKGLYIKPLYLISSLLVATTISGCALLGGGIETMLGLSGPKKGAKLASEVIATQPLHKAVGLAKEEGRVAHWWNNAGT